MKIYAKYDFYVEKYGGKEIGEEDFSAASLHATQYIKYITLGHSEKYQGEELQYAACAVADAYNAVFNQQNGTGIEKKSENTDGYSVSYVVQGKDGESKEELFRRKANEVVRYWLANTGLLDRRVRCGHADECGYHYL